MSDSIRAGDKVWWRGKSMRRTGVVVRMFSKMVQIRNDRGNEYWLSLTKMHRLDGPLNAGTGDGKGATIRELVDDYELYTVGGAGDLGGAEIV